ncbi:unnamed protein product [Plutella xylostella]|uniref:(diamondback moth) hypothetical protein n=1 Tax=Plutella xylostella TaxID=51655 RepID=A0A8S4FZE5_PLUXY|nr:unnamed protein product [Plutella xylostella]
MVRKFRTIIPSLHVTLHPCVSALTIAVVNLALFAGVSLVYIMWVLPGLLPWGGGGGAWFLSLCHLLGALAPWCGSFLYHLFMNHAPRRRALPPALAARYARHMGLAEHW